MQKNSLFEAQNVYKNATYNIIDTLPEITNGININTRKLNNI